MPAAPPRRPAEAALFDGTRLALDGHTALEERVAEFEGIVLRGELPSDVTLPEDDALVVLLRACLRLNAAPSDVEWSASVIPVDDFAAKLAAMAFGKLDEALYQQLELAQVLVARGKTV